MEPHKYFVPGENGEFVWNLFAVIDGFCNPYQLSAASIDGFNVEFDALVKSEQWRHNGIEQESQNEYHYPMLDSSGRAFLLVVTKAP